MHSLNLWSFLLSYSDPPIPGRELTVGPAQLLTPGPALPSPVTLEIIGFISDAAQGSAELSRILGSPQAAKV